MTGPGAGAARPAVEVLLGFARALRAAGVPVTQDRSRSYLEAVAILGLDDLPGTYAAGRATLCGSPDDLSRYDEIFTAWFGDPAALGTGRAPATATATIVDLPLDELGPGEETSEGEDPVRARASAAEVLRHRDVSALSAAERARLAVLFGGLRVRPPWRRTFRHRRWHRGEVDAARTLRASLRRMGEPGEIAWRRPGVRPRRVVLLIDVSGSMSGYTEALLRLGHRLVTAPASAGRVEVFTVGTRLTRVSAALRHRDPERALAAAGDSVPDWSGGTRLGEGLQAFMDRWGRRGMARGAVVVIASDGWERGSVDQLAEQVARLHRVAHRVVWVNPHRGKVGYEPLQRGIVAVLPHLDDFVAGHSLATYAELVEVIGRA
ncbi:vWA domain-containing protein [Nocardioides insulae]|uniref:vWA domain-containing protein n=1 Tax=Nocardioides insulae TaxID=394734 RepID=UPI0003F704AA|nr:VWA domain-containing protein [Nocardioides insulae]